MSETPPAQNRSVAGLAWLIVILGLAAAIGLGICRFAYALVLPDMRDSLGWSYAAAGFMNTANAAGYLAGALGAARVIARAGLFRTLWVSAAICAATLAVSAMSGDFWVLSTARVTSGVAAAFVFVAGSTMAANLAQGRPEQSAFLMSLFYTGPAIGIIVSGLIAPFILDAQGPGSWWQVWAALAVVAIAFTMLLPLARMASAPTQNEQSRADFALRPVGFILTGYFLFGAGYIAYMTFMIAFVRDHGGGAIAQSAFWCMLGLGSLVSPWIWAGAIARNRRGRATALLAAITMAGAALPLLSVHPLWLAISAVAFGNTFFALVASITAFVRQNYPPDAWARGIAVMTAGFGLGQMLGPLATGAITDATGSLVFALVASASLLAVSALTILGQREIAG